MAAPQWIDVSNLSFNTLMLLEDPHLRWFPRKWPDNELAIALKYNRSVYDFFRMRLGDNGDWLEALISKADDTDQDMIRICEISVMKTICDWIVYVYCPEEYDKQPFLRWDNDELLSLADYNGKIVADIGSGTGRLLEPLVASAKTIYAVEPIKSLRDFMKSKFFEHAHKFFVLDGLITDIPLPDNSCDILLSGHVFGDFPRDEIYEMERVTRPGGMVILCPGNSDVDNDTHEILMSRKYEWSVFHEPVNGAKRKYWRTV